MPSDEELRVKKRELLARWVFPALLTKDLLEAKKAIKYQAVATREGLEAIRSEISGTREEIALLRRDMLSALHEIRDTLQKLPEEEIRAQLRFKAYMVALTNDPEELARAIYYWENVLGEPISDPYRGVNIQVILSFAEYIDPSLNEAEKTILLSGETLINPWDRSLPPDYIVYASLYRILPYRVSKRVLEIEELYVGLKHLDENTKRNIVSREGFGKLTETLYKLGILDTTEYYYIRSRIKKWRYVKISVIAKQFAKLKTKTQKPIPEHDPYTLLILVLEELEQITNTIKDKETKEKIKNLLDKYKKIIKIKTEAG